MIVLAPDILGLITLDDSGLLAPDVLGLTNLDDLGLIAPDVLGLIILAFTKHLISVTSGISGISSNLVSPTTREPQK